MATYQDFNKIIKETVQIDADPTKRWSPQKVRFINNENEFYGTFYGKVKASEFFASKASLSNVDLSSCRLYDEDGHMIDLKGIVSSLIEISGIAITDHIRLGDLEYNVIPTLSTNIIKYVDEVSASLSNLIDEKIAEGQGTFYKDLSAISSVLSDAIVDERSERYENDKALSDIITEISGKIQGGVVFRGAVHTEDSKCLDSEVSSLIFSYEKQFGDDPTVRTGYMYVVNGPKKTFNDTITVQMGDYIFLNSYCGERKVSEVNKTVVEVVDAVDGELYERIGKLSSDVSVINDKIDAANGTFELASGSDVSVITKIVQSDGKVTVDSRRLVSSDVLGLDDFVEKTVDDKIESLDSIVVSGDHKFLNSIYEQNGVICAECRRIEDSDFEVNQISQSKVSGLVSDIESVNSRIDTVSTYVEGLGVTNGIGEGGYILSSLTQEKGQLKYGTTKLLSSHVDGLSDYVDSAIKGKIDGLNVATLSSDGEFVFGIRQDNGLVSAYTRTIQDGDIAAGSIGQSKITDLTSDLFNISSQLSTIDRRNKDDVTFMGDFGSVEYSNRVSLSAYLQDATGKAFDYRIRRGFMWREPYRQELSCGDELKTFGVNDYVMANEDFVISDATFGKFNYLKDAKAHVDEIYTDIDGRISLSVATLSVDKVMASYGQVFGEIWQSNGKISATTRSLSVEDLEGLSDLIDTRISAKVDSLSVAEIEAGTKKVFDKIWENKGIVSASTRELSADDIVGLGDFVDTKIDELDGEVLSAGRFVVSVTQTDGKISGTTDTVRDEYIEDGAISQIKITNLTSDLSGLSAGLEDVKRWNRGDVSLMGDFKNWTKTIEQYVDLSNYLRTAIEKELSCKLRKGFMYRQVVEQRLCCGEDLDTWRQNDFIIVKEDTVLSDATLSSFFYIRDFAKQLNGLSVNLQEQITTNKTNITNLAEKVNGLSVGNKISKGEIITSLSQSQGRLNYEKATLSTNHISGLEELVDGHIDTKIESTVKSLSSETFTAETKSVFDKIWESDGVISATTRNLSTEDIEGLCTLIDGKIDSKVETLNGEIVKEGEVVVSVLQTNGTISGVTDTIGDTYIKDEAISQMKIRGLSSDLANISAEISDDISLKGDLSRTPGEDRTFWKYIHGSTRISPEKNIGRGWMYRMPIDRDMSALMSGEIKWESFYENDFLIFKEDTVVSDATFDSYYKICDLNKSIRNLDTRYVKLSGGNVISNYNEFTGVNKFNTISVNFECLYDDSDDRYLSAELDPLNDPRILEIVGRINDIIEYAVLSVQKITDLKSTICNDIKNKTKEIYKIAFPEEEEPDPQTFGEMKMLLNKVIDVLTVGGNGLALHSVLKRLKDRTSKAEQYVGILNDDLSALCVHVNQKIDKVGSDLYDLSSHISSSTELADNTFYQEIIGGVKVNSLKIVDHTDETKPVAERDEYVLTFLSGTMCLKKVTKN